MSKKSEKDREVELQRLQKVVREGLKQAAVERAQRAS
jgi:16S rRNA U1498 N3-methylase RsmE